MAARKSLGGAGLPPLADLFSTSDERALEAQTQERVMMLPVSELHDFPGHPFRVRDDEEMEKLAESITQHGILMPGLVRPRAAGGYEIVAGHRRKFASMKAGMREMPVIVRDMDDDTAVILMVDSNVQRENVLPSEKARAYKMKLDAMKRQGERTDLTSAGIRQKLSSVQKIADDVPFPVSWTVKMKKKQKETQDILSYHTQAAGCSDKARAKASGGRQPIEECGRTGL